MLKQLIDHKRAEVAERKRLYPLALLERSLHFEAPTVSLAEYVCRPDKSGVIAEFKRASPSEGKFAKPHSVEQVSIGYMQAGASALSVLTDNRFFGGSSADLTEARKYNFCPILRKDFILEEYQIVESRAIGADAILLIAACLGKNELAQLCAFAQGLGLEVLVEVHEADEVGKLPACDLVGVNNRDLKRFRTDIEQSLALRPLLPQGIPCISESGIHHPEEALRLREAGYDGFLIGTAFMRSSNPGEACRKFTKALGRGKEVLR